MKLLFLSLALLITETWPAAFHRINNGANQDVTEWSMCRNINNSSGHDIFVPTQSSAEWSTFTANSPSGVSIGNCGPCPAIEFVGSSSANGDVTALTIPLPGGTSLGDVIVARIATRGTITSTGLPTPAGWTKLGADILMGSGGGSNSQRSAVYYVVVTATELSAGNAVWNLGGTGEVAGGMAAYRNVDNASPIDDNSAVSYTANASTIAAQAVTTTAARSMVVLLYSINNNLTLTAPAPFTQRFVEYYSNRVGTGLAESIQESAGSSGTPDISISANQNRRSIAAVALRQKSTCP